MKLQHFLSVWLHFSVLANCQTTFLEKEKEAKKNLFTAPSLPVVAEDILAPTVLIALFVRNKEHSLPYFLNAIYDLHYPKDRIRIRIVTDHNKDSSAKLLEQWVDVHKEDYHKVQLKIEKSKNYYEHQKSDMDWPEERHLRMLQLRQEALDLARRKWADFILFVDADNLLLNPYVLWHLIADDVTLVAPMLESPAAYSNFWCGQDEKGYYVRTDDYFPTTKRERVGVFQVPMIHSTFLIDLRKKDSRLLQFWPLREDYKLALDDIIVFSMHSKAAGVAMHIDNRYFYGYLPVPLQPHQTLEEEKYTFIHLLMEVMTEPPVGIAVEVKSSEVFQSKPTATKLGFDEIYMINLLRRPDRYHRMEAVLQLQGIHFKHFQAVDSKSFNTSYLRRMGIDMLPGFVDPYHKRTLTRGEIGCFLSHYFIWQEIVEKNYSRVIVFEDDVRFEYQFVNKLNAVMNEVESLELNWDLIYIGRKRMQTKAPEKRVQGSEWLVEADYSFWTLGYLLSNAGAQKLLAGDPLGKMVPVDEYLPIMFNKHPIEKYMNQFPVRNVAAYSTEPLLVYPTHYTGQENYFSDTETSSIWEEIGKKDEL